MEAHISRRAHFAACFALSIIVANLSSSVLAASYRTPNFIVSARSATFAKQVGDQAEVFRRELALDWLGHELPNWGQPCPITVDVGANKGAGGATTFMFDQNRPFGWTMEIQGSEQRILDSVLPHEITHTIFATHFGRPLPRWADEGACTTVECASEKANHERMLRIYLTSSPSRGIAFNRMVAMTEYPHDIMPLYAQGHSVVQYLLYHGGRQKFVAFLGEGMQHNDWDVAVRSHYGYQDLSDLQLKWVAWVRQGSPAFDPNQPAAPAEESLAQSRGTTPANGADVVIRGQAPQKSGIFGALTGGDSWYARQRTPVAEASDENTRATEATLGDPHRGPVESDSEVALNGSVAGLTPVPQVSSANAALETVPRTPDQRPRPMFPARTADASNSRVWQPAGTSVVRKPIPATTAQVKDLHRRPILFDAPIGTANTVWR